MLFNGNFMEDWGADEPRVSKLVFIGRNLNKKELEEGFAACLHTPELQKRKIEALRFSVGDAVECHVEGGSRGTAGQGRWAKGKVVAQLYHDEFMPPGAEAAYQVKLDAGDDLIYAPADQDRFIRKVNDKRKFEALRFSVGDAVECHVEGGSRGTAGRGRWAKGKVVAQLYHDEFMPPGAEAAYQVKLDAGCAGCDAASCDDLIYAPADHDRFIRKAND
jgi:hypothetical protein